MQGYLNHPAVVMVAGGIGVTPMMSALRTLSENGASLPIVQRAVFVWVVKKESVVDAYRSELTKLQSLGRTSNGGQLDILVNATLSEREDDVDFVPVQIEAPPQQQSPKSSSQGQFRRLLLQGYGHMLILTIAAGDGYLLGIFLANVIVYEHGLEFRVKVLAPIGLSRSSCRRSGLLWRQLLVY